MAGSENRMAGNEERRMMNKEGKSGGCGTGNDGVNQLGGGGAGGQGRSGSQSEVGLKVEAEERRTDEGQRT